MGERLESELFIPWTEKYRPAKLGDVVGHEIIVDRIKNLMISKQLPNMLFAGRAGVGKTTTVMALVNELYGDKANECHISLNASDERGIDIVRGKIKDFARTMSLASVPFKLIFLDEADALTSDAQQALRTTMERYSSNVRFILSCNYSSRIIEPLQSRCAVFRFSSLTKENLRKMLDFVVSREGLKLDEKAIEAIIYVAEGDGRKLLNVLQGCADSSKKISEADVFKIASRARPEEIKKMIDAAIDGKFSDARKLLSTLMLSYGLSGEDIVEQVFKVVSDSTYDDKFKILLIDKIGEYDFRITEGANEAIQLEALLAQMMLLKWKFDSKQV